jgi:hypothetical protein
MLASTRRRQRGGHGCDDLAAAGDELAGVEPLSICLRVNDSVQLAYPNPLPDSTIDIMMLAPLNLPISLNLWGLGRRIDTSRHQRPQSAVQCRKVT